MSRGFTFDKLYKIGGFLMWFPCCNWCEIDRRNDHDRCRFWDNLMFTHCSCDVKECSRQKRKDVEDEVRCFKIKDKHECGCHKKKPQHHRNDCGCFKKLEHQCNCCHKCHCHKCRRDH